MFGSLQCRTYPDRTTRTQRIAHEKVEEQRIQLQEQEKQVALLRARIALLEGSNEVAKQNGDSVDDFSIKVRATQRTRVYSSLSLF